MLIASLDKQKMYKGGCKLYTHANFAVLETATMCFCFFIMWGHADYMHLQILLY